MNRTFDAIEAWSGRHDDDSEYPSHDDSDVAEFGAPDWYGVYTHEPNSGLFWQMDCQTAAEAREAAKLLAAIYNVPFYDYIVD